MKDAKQSLKYWCKVAGVTILFLLGLILFSVIVGIVITLITTTLVTLLLLVLPKTVVNVLLILFVLCCAGAFVSKYVVRRENESL
jgi:hypothetical protein